MARASEAGAVMFACALLAGCAAKKPVLILDDRDGGFAPFVMTRKTELPPGKRKDLPPDPSVEAVARKAVWVSSTSGERLALPQRGAAEPPLARASGDALRPEASTMTAAGPAAPRPDGAAPQGHPQAQHPDELTPLPSERPQNYVSPAPLEKQEELAQPKERALAGVAPAAEEPVIDLSAAPASFPPQSTGVAGDEVPDTGVSDPTEIGSYHIEVATSPGFAPVFFDKVYPFMADIDLRTDLLVKKTKPGIYWIRYALVDLLGFEHPASKPRRVLLR